jgi:hypothetical protein
MSVNVWYVGFKSMAMVREYTFLVQESSAEPHEIIFWFQFAAKMAPQTFHVL